MINLPEHAVATNTRASGISSRRAGGWLLDVMLGAISGYAAIILAIETTAGLAPLRLAAVLLAAAYGGLSCSAVLRRTPY